MEFWHKIRFTFWTLPSRSGRFRSWLLITFIELAGSLTKSALAEAQQAAVDAPVIAHAERTGTARSDRPVKKRKVGPLEVLLAGVRFAPGREAPYARFPFWNMENNGDLLAAVNAAPASQLALRSELHSRTLASSNDLWYLGGGTFQPRTFGYSGRPGNGNESLASVGMSALTTLW